MADLGSDEDQEAPATGADEAPQGTYVQEQQELREAFLQVWPAGTQNAVSIK